MSRGNNNRISVKHWEIEEFLDVDKEQESYCVKYRDSEYRNKTLAAKAKARFRDEISQEIDLNNGKIRIVWKLQWIHFSRLENVSQQLELFNKKHKFRLPDLYDS